MEIEAIPAFRDNYLWLARAGRTAIVVDPGDAAPVAARLHECGLRLAAILITHHHADHVGGLVKLAGTYAAPVYGPAHEAIEGVTHPVREGDWVELTDWEEAPPLRFQVLEVPGHTLGHVAYYRPNTLFCGDTLFGAGCGRLFEGTPQQMWGSLARLAALPPDTLVYCAHEYTESNLQFAAVADPDNPALAERRRQVAELRAAGRPSVPFRLAEELATNPFLRAGEPALRAAAAGMSGRQPESATDCFAMLRAWKDAFRA
ncbi:MAG: hydroxyacylglutathione hydrolase [Rhodocyclaceae bacterium]|nr:hydroxyacylglutathione hydrolase [Rhodocyclaceae bacterium]